MWETLGTIAEHIAYAISVVGLTGLAWHVAGTVVDKLITRKREKQE
jgi:hypothetical protein